MGRSLLYSSANDRLRRTDVAVVIMYMDLAPGVYPGSVMVLGDVE